MNLREIKKVEKDGSEKTMLVDWDKMPCAKCEWNKKGEYKVY